MSFQKILRAVAAFVSIITSVNAQQSGNMLTGDPATACQVILCLSSGIRPGECAAPLARYFAISFKYWSDTVTARRNFLNLCPTARNRTSTDMPALIDAMANEAGRCDAATLNAQLAQIVKVPHCKGRGENRSCWTEQVTVISPQEPAYCQIYTTNSNTYLLRVTYIGDPMKGGHWVNASGQ